MKRALMGGRNRTGVSVAPELAERMLEAPEEFPPSSPGSAELIAQERAEYARAAEPIGTMPPPASFKQAARTVVQAATGAHPLILQDKLSERLAFERAGTRLYEALLSKHDAGRTFRGGPSRQDIQHIRDEEHAHMTMLLEVIARTGGDPTVVSPSANVQAVASKGLPAVLADPRTDMLQCLEALLVAELTDNDCWTALIELAEAAGEIDMAAQFRQALEHEGEHLEMVRGWVAAGTGRSVERARSLSRPLAAPAPTSGGRSGTSGGRAETPGKTRSRGRKRNTRRRASRRHKAGSKVASKARRKRVRR
jgi:rubrerythrin